MEDELNIVFYNDRTKLLKQIRSKKARALICDHEFPIRYLSEEEKKNHPDAKYRVDFGDGLFNTWSMWWDGKWHSIHHLYYDVMMAY